MANFPRTVLPRAVTGFMGPGALRAWTQEGKYQARSIVQMGRRWIEEYPPLKMTDAATRGWLEQVLQIWGLGTIFDISHRAYLTHNGGGSGSPTVSGGGQTGSTLITTGWSGSTPYLRAGDIIRVAGLNYALGMTADSSAGTLSIFPPIPVGGSPAGGAAVTYTGVVLRAVLAEPPDIPLSLPGNGFLAGVKLVFREAV